MFVLHPIQRGRVHFTSSCDTTHGSCQVEPAIESGRSDDSAILAFLPLDRANLQLNGSNWRYSVNDRNYI